jgi:hypothetical protein
MAKGKRGLKFTVPDVESLLKVIDEIVPIGNPNSCYGDGEQKRGGGGPQQTTTKPKQNINHLKVK